MTDITLTLRNTMSFLRVLRLKIKLMSDDEFYKLLDNCASRDQILYALYFRLN